MENDLYTIHHVEAAQCIWEAVLDDLRANGVAERVRRSVGTAELRYQLRDHEILDACEAGWDLLERLGMQDKIGPYDWEYVPWFVWNCLDWDTDGGFVTLKPNWDTLIEQLKED
ncbi:hypothetical protein [Desulfovibrio oxyclinae]|uniref:hypothetical protein n=1 Tax=Desulfovibrio oxyclinae TaxID=63560 RepID=UPI000364410B|nr:hypothetical protein [Desulfovibrio oxyclinae]